MQVGFDEAPQDGEFLIERAEKVVLVDRVRNCSALTRIVFQPDRHWVFETQSSEVTHGLCLGGREEERLSGRREVGEQSRKGFVESHIQYSVSFVEDWRDSVRVREPDERHAPSICRLLQSKPHVWSICCSKRPGVATTMFIFANRSRSPLTSFPPIIRPAEKEWYPPIERNTSNICTACRI